MQGGKEPGKEDMGPRGTLCLMNLLPLTTGREEGGCLQACCPQREKKEVFLSFLSLWEESEAPTPGCLGITETHHASLPGKTFFIVYKLRIIPFAQS